MGKLPPHSDVPAPFSTNLSFPLSFSLFFFFKTQTLGKVTQQSRDRIELSFFFFFLASNARMQSIVSLGGELSMGKCFGKRATKENGRRG